MSNRDEMLVNEGRKLHDAWFDGPDMEPRDRMIRMAKVAREIHKPRTITSREDLATLDDGSYIMSGSRYPMYANALWRVSSGMVTRVGRELEGVTPFGFFVDPLPATVIFEPEASK